MKKYRLAAFAAVLCAIAAPALSQAVVNLADPAVSSQRAAVDSSGNVSIKGTVNIISAATASNGLNGKASVTDTTSTSLHALVTSKSIYVTGWSCDNSGATSVIVNFQDGSGGTTLFTIEVPAGGGNNMAAGGGAWFNTTSGTALYFAAGGSTTTLYCGFVGFSQ